MAGGAEHAQHVHPSRQRVFWELIGHRDAITARDGNSPFSTNVLAAFPRSSQASRPGGTIVTKDWSDQNNQTVTTDTEVTRIVFGLNGSISETWSWDAYFQHGETTRDQIGDGYATNWRYYMATDAVINPANGQPICRAV